MHNVLKLKILNQENPDMTSLLILIVLYILSKGTSHEKDTDSH